MAFGFSGGSRHSPPATVAAILSSPSPPPRACRSESCRRSRLACASTPACSLPHPTRATARSPATVLHPQILQSPDNVSGCDLRTYETAAAISDRRGLKAKGSGLERVDREQVPVGVGGAAVARGDADGRGYVRVHRPEVPVRRLVPDDEVTVVVVDGPVVGGGPVVAVGHHVGRGTVAV